MNDIDRKILYSKGLYPQEKENNDIVSRAIKNPLVRIRKQEEINQLMAHILQQPIDIFEKDDKKTLIDYMSDPNNSDYQEETLFILKNKQLPNKQNIDETKIISCLIINLTNKNHQNCEKTEKENFVLCTELSNHINTMYLLNRQYYSFDIKNLLTDLDKFFQKETATFSKVHSEISSLANKWKKNSDPGVQNLACRVLGVLAEASVSYCSISQTKVLEFLKQYKNHHQTCNLFLDDLIQEIQQGKLKISETPKYQEFCR